MKLTDLNPRWFTTGGEGVTDKDGNPIPERHGLGVIFDCPCGAPECGIGTPFRNPLDGGPAPEGWAAAWHREGDTFETLTLTPSILNRGCGWHGYVTNGEIVVC